MKRKYSFPFIITVAALFLLTVANWNTVKSEKSSTTKEITMVVKDGAKVSFNYTLKMDGKVVDSSDGKPPLTYTQGAGEIIPGLEEQMAGLKAGDKKSIVVTPENAYGEHNPKAMQKVPKTAFKDPKALRVGSIVSGQAQGKEFEAIVASLDDKDVTLDFNLPFAGKTLNFDVEVVSVQ